MDRVVHAMESDSVHASPYTADLAGQLTDDIAETASPALQQVGAYYVASSSCTGRV